MVITKAENPKKVLVIGGGLAGMEAGRVAALSGHKVTLMEKEEYLGGQLLSASIPPFKEAIGKLNQYLALQIKKAGVEIKLGQAANEKVITDFSPDELILAMGAKPASLDISGINLPNVFNPLEVLLSKRRIIGERVIVMGGGLIGSETADHLASCGKKVTITTRQERIAHDVGLSNRWVLLARLRKAGVRIETNFEPVEVLPNGLKGLREGKETFLEGDSVIVAAGMKSEDNLAKVLKEKGIKFHQIGDCLQPRGIREALVEGYRAGTNL